MKSLYVRVSKIENSKQTVEDVTTWNSKIWNLKLANDAIKMENKKNVFDTITDLRCRWYIENLLFQECAETEDETSKNKIGTVASICQD